MKKCEIELINKLLSKLVGQPLRKICRAAATVLMSYGDDDGYALHVDCSFRMTCGSRIVFAISDMFLTSTKLIEEDDFDWGSFEWDVIGNNRFDERVKKYFYDEPFGFIVKKISVSKLGDLAISFENGFELELFASGLEENWRFFECGDTDYHLVIAGGKIERGR